MNQDHPTTITHQTTSSSPQSPDPATPGPLESHAIAELFPLMEPNDLASLAQNNREHGLHIVLFKGRILDGRNRWCACQLAGVEPRTRIFPADGNPLAACPEPAERVVLSANLHRRHLTTSQRGLLDAKIANLPHGGANKKQGTNSSLAPSIDEEHAKNQEPNSALDPSRPPPQPYDRCQTDGNQRVAVDVWGAHLVSSAGFAVPAKRTFPPGISISSARHGEATETRGEDGLPESAFEESSDLNNETPAS
jgi:hypothetical protein